LYNIFKNEFIIFPNTLESHEYNPSIVVQDNNVIYVISGQNGSTVFNTHEAYFPLNNSWVTLTSAPIVCKIED